MCDGPGRNRQASQISPGKANPTKSMTIKDATPNASATIVPRDRFMTDLISFVMRCSFNVLLLLLTHIMNYL